MRKLGERQVDCLIYILNDGEVHTISDFTSRCGSWDNAKTMLDSLQKRGLVEDGQIVSGAPHKWMITDVGKKAVADEMVRRRKTFIVTIDGHIIEDVRNQYTGEDMLENEAGDKTMRDMIIKGLLSEGTMLEESDLKDMLLTVNPIKANNIVSILNNLLDIKGKICFKHCFGPKHSALCQSLTELYREIKSLGGE